MSDQQHPSLPLLLRTAFPPDNPMQIPQFIHRISILSHLRIPSGSTVLEIGCGQGDATIALADAVGPEGKITAVDPAPLDYGRPYTLGQAQTHVRESVPLGSRIEFVQDDPEHFVKNSNGEKRWDSAIAIHSLWYFSSPAKIADLFSALSSSNGEVGRLLVAEWSFKASEASQEAHVTCAKIRAAISKVIDPATNTGNIRTAATPQQLIELAESSGWKLSSQGTFTPEEGLQDGRWEIGEVMSKDFIKKIEEVFKDDGGEQKRVLGLREDMIKTLKGQGAIDGEGKTVKEEWKKVRCMDTWWGEFTKA